MHTTATLTSAARATLGCALLSGLLLFGACTPQADAAGPTATTTATAGAATTAGAKANATVDAAIRKTLAERIPSLPKIDEITQTPVEGLYEVRYGGTELVYSDAKGHFLVQGTVTDTKTMKDLTEERIEKLTAVAFAALPLKDAMPIVQGNGKRKMAVFVDPNCGYCKRFERDMLAVKDVTIYTFLMPILGPDSATKSRDIWCAANPGKVWREWMIENVPPKAADPATAKCDIEALQRNVAFGQKHRINGTPGLVFESGARKSGAMPADAVEALLAAKKG